MWLFDLLFSSIPQIWYVEVWISQSVSESPLDFEITRVDCSTVDLLKRSVTWRVRDCENLGYIRYPKLSNLSKISLEKNFDSRGAGLLSLWTPFEYVPEHKRNAATQLILRIRKSARCHPSRLLSVAMFCSNKWFADVQTDFGLFSSHLPGRHVFVCCSPVMYMYFQQYDTVTWVEKYSFLQYLLQPWDIEIY